MERDIRDLFKEKEDFGKELPENHRKEFLEKLQKQNSKSSKFRLMNFIKVAAVVLVFFSIYQFLNTSKQSINNSTKIQATVKALEREYLPSITKEWNKFLKVTNDSILINKYQQRLKNSKEEYKKLSKLITENEDNVQLLQLLIINLQNRLVIINEINNHIKELNQKNKSNETIII